MTNKQHEEEMRQLYREANIPRMVHGLDADEVFPKAVEAIRKFRRDKPVWFQAPERPTPLRHGSESYEAWRKGTELWWGCARKLVSMNRSVKCVDTLAAIQYASDDWSGFLGKYDHHYLFLDGFGRYALRFTEEQRIVLLRLLQRWQDTAEMVWLYSHITHTDYVDRLRKLSTVPPELLEFHRGGVYKMTATKYV